MTDDTKKEAGLRDRTMRFRVTAQEGQEIEARAAQAGLTSSAYLRAAGLNHPIRAIADLDAVTDLVRVNGDLGRVAGLLKLWLAEKRGEGASPVDVETVMREFRAQQAKLSAIMGQLVRGK
ncbi:conjugal transfer protein TraJ [Burkholderia multivorans]|uniref:plasmid mobilization protein n=1 Tax=Pseudomonadota TaxID=1224 RepID=UPI000CFE97CC|nr:CopG family transcriptional regulator [Burkholderia multivorans]MBU9652820.1 conjugal transfer protein TraJ [Burkholderia multivorans]MCA7959048.1 conjugal transfer protein TraJ [Burkholderia multivorans]MCO1382025.1 conjugal transfer protein TraJ [Burkholderia multivorans]MCO1402166.1 conjugal transfer protein TraJ [Burkholderia multivorans]MDN7971295.1 conjugal transfer protein TraJ [Burkholderia multivorans]